jgi:hypothetical protein
MAAPHIGIAELDVQAGYHFRIGRIAADSIEPGLKDSDRFVDRAGRIIVLPALERLGRRRTDGLGGLGG